MFKCAGDREERVSGIDLIPSSLSERDLANALQRRYTEQAI